MLVARLESIQLEVPQAVQILRELEVTVIVKLKTVLVAALPASLGSSTPPSSTN
jgi:hypothetical protein